MFRSIEVESVSNNACFAGGMNLLPFFSPVPMARQVQSRNCQVCAVSCKCLTESRYGLLMSDFSWNSGVSASVVSLASVSLKQDNTIEREEKQKNHRKSALLP